MATFPDLPPPITPDSPTESDPAHLPVEPDDGAPAPAGVRLTSSFRSFHTAFALHFLANPQFMLAAAFRWPRARASLYPA